MKTIVEKELNRLSLEITDLPKDFSYTYACYRGVEEEVELLRNDIENAKANDDKSLLAYLQLALNYNKGLDPNAKFGLKPDTKFTGGFRNSPIFDIIHKLEYSGETACKNSVAYCVKGVLDSEIKFMKKTLRLFNTTLKLQAYHLDEIVVILREAKTPDEAVDSLMTDLHIKKREAEFIAKEMTLRYLCNPRLGLDERASVEGILSYLEYLKSIDNEHRLLPAKCIVTGNVKPYKVGDYYNENGKEGVVFEVDETGLHGKIVGMKQSKEDLRWCTKEEFARKIVIGATDDNDGMTNMQTIMQIPDWQAKFPAFVWCAAQGDGWYLPAINELKKFTLDASVHDAVNNTLMQKCGDLLFNIGENQWYWSSSETRRSFANLVGMNLGVCQSIKHYYFYVRAVSTF